MSVVEGSVSSVERSVVELLGRGEVSSGSRVVARTGSNPAVGWLVVEPDAPGKPRGQHRCMVVSSSGEVLVSGFVPDVTLPGEPLPSIEPTPGWVVPFATGIWDREQLTNDLREARMTLQQERSRLESIVDAAHEYADDNDLCERFDSFMIEQGLRPRMRDYDVIVDVKLRVAVSVSARSADTASNDVGRYEIADAIENRYHGGFRDLIEDYDVVDVEAA